MSPRTRLSTGSLASKRPSISSITKSHPSTSPPLPIYDHDLATALIKSKQDPNTLSLKELQHLCRHQGRLTTGRKAELLARLTTTTSSSLDIPFSLPTPESQADDTIPVIAAPTATKSTIKTAPPTTTSTTATQIIPYDNIGLDPTTLIGTHIHRYEHDSHSLRFYTQSGTCIALAISTPRSPNPELDIDTSLFDALFPISDFQIAVIDGKAKVVSRDAEYRPRGGVMVMDAAVGVRKGKGRDKGRVVGVRCEGMEGLGWVWAREGVGGRFSGVGIASGRVEGRWVFE